ncbi:MAG: hypothetical protein HUJ79_06185 [Firmicutes bacterium]|nr:hypothetical protein [Bacillota bacterium]
MSKCKISKHINKQGNSVVFLTIILATLISITLTLVFASRQQAQISIADGALNLAGTSILSEYDYYVQKDYGIFLLRGTDKEFSGYLKDYSGYPGTVTAGRYSTANIEPVRKQILEYMKLTGAADSLGKSSSSETAATEEHTLRHGPTITSLPSRSLPDKSIVTSAQQLADNIKNPEAIFRGGTNKYLLDSYILSKFNNSTCVSRSDHFFSREVEYIICGELSDAANKRKTDLALEAFRTGLNLTHIYSDPEKVAAITAAAEVITPGVLGTVTQAGIAAVWAAAEAVNDVKLLHNGKRVPIVKDKTSWALELESLLNGYDAQEGCISPAIDKGRTYNDYLRILLFIKDDNIKTARILDLIQINMRKNHDSEFLIQECATGISIDAYVNEKKLSYDKVY